MLPDPEDEPAGAAEVLCDLSVAFHISTQLPIPELHVRRRHGCMLGAPMPEAAVHEDRYALTREDDIGSAGKAGSDAVAKAATKEQAAKRNLGASVSAADLRHAVAALRLSQYVSHASNCYRKRRTAARVKATWKGDSPRELGYRA